MTRLVPALLFVVGCAPETDALERPTTIPEDAIEIAPDVFSLGEMIDPESGELIEGIAFVERAPGFGPEADVPEDLDFPGLDAKGRPGSSCYAAIGYPGWTTAEPWGVGTTGSSGLTAAEVRTSIESAIGAWESASSANIFGNYASANSGVAKTTADGQNNIQFGNAGGGGTVAVTYVWGSRRSAIFEWDQIYGDNWTWNNDPAAPTSDDFEFLSVATHEVGHAAGMDHPASTCTAETMYAYVDFGETFQTTLNTGDIAGINALY